MERAQIRAARALLGWSQEDLARQSGVSIATIRRLEPGPEPIKASDEVVLKIEAALRSAGVELINSEASSDGGGIGVRLADSNDRARWVFVLNQIDDAALAARKAITSSKGSGLTELLTSALRSLEQAAKDVAVEIAYVDDILNGPSDGIDDGIPRE